MATLIQAYSEFGPRLKLLPRARLRELTRRLSMASGVRPGEVMLVLNELQDALLDLGQHCTPLEIDGVGSFTPSIRGNGELRINYRPDRALMVAFGSLKAFRGEIINRENIGLSPEGYKQLWDAAHPEDPLDLSTVPAKAA